MEYDVAVAGLGGMGSAVLAHCAARGASVIGFEQYRPVHDLGSSHGKMRMIRKAYFEEPAYVPLLLRAYELWHKLARANGAEILRTTGVLTVGVETSEIIAGTLRASAEHGLAIETLSRREAQARYPMMRLRADEAAIFEREAGVLDPEAAVAAHLCQAKKHGAEARFEVAMESWQATGGGFEIFLSDGKRITARRLVLALGPWFKSTLETLGIPIQVQRNVQVWFTPERPAFASPACPAFLVDRVGLPAPLYGFPDFGDGVKAAFHGGGENTADAAHLDRTIDHERDVKPLQRAMEGWMPGAAATFQKASVCMYTCTPDEHFVIDRHPEHSDVILSGGFSGHGFKFAPIIGEIAADLALEGGTRHAIDFLSLRRFRAAVA